MSLLILVVLYLDKSRFWIFSYFGKRISWFFLTQSVRVLEPLEKIPRFAKEYRSGNLYQYCSLCLLGFLVKPMFLHHTSCFVLFFCSPEVPIPKRTVKKMEERGAWQTPCEELFSERKPLRKENPQCSRIL